MGAGWIQDATPAVFYMLHDTFILRGTITIERREDLLGLRGSMDRGGGLPNISHIGMCRPIG